MIPTNPTRTQYETDCAFLILDMAKFKAQQSVNPQFLQSNYDTLFKQWQQLDPTYTGFRDKMTEQEFNSYTVTAAKATKFFSKYIPSIRQTLQSFNATRPTLTGCQPGLGSQGSPSAEPLFRFPDLTPPSNASSIPPVFSFTQSASAVPPTPGQKILAIKARAQFEGVICFYDDKVDNLTGCFGNFHICPNKIEFGGKRYSNSEAVFQSQKFKDSAIVFNQFNENTDGDQAVTIARNNQLNSTQIQSWDDRKIGVMMNALRAKFGQNPTLKEMLLATGNAYLLEHLPDANRRDAYWSDGYDGSGRNELGICLMKLRAEYGGTGVVTRPTHDNSKFEKNYTKSNQVQYPAPSQGQTLCKVQGCGRAVFDNHAFCGKTHADAYFNQHGSY